MTPATPEPVAGLILAAGRSSRMGSPKALLRFGGHTALEQIVLRMGRAGLRDLRVVIGHGADEIRLAHPGLPVHWIEHPHHHQGMLSSILAGVARLRGEADALLLQPVDMPLVRSATFAALLARWRQAAAPVIYPVFRQRRGHPPLIALAAIPDDSDWNLPGGLRTLLHRFDPDQADYIAVEDPGILLDFDTPQDLARGMDTPESLLT
jgi:molybdenum cofactor cytidylyltransferase